MLLYLAGGGSIPGKLTEIASLSLTDIDAYRYGTVYLFLQLVPPFSMFFLLTSAVSSALWAADLENGRRAQHTNPVQTPQYTDEPEGVV